MKLKQILENNSVNLKECFYEESLQIKDTTTSELFDLIISSDEFSACKEIKCCHKEDVKNLTTLLLTDEIKLNQYIKLKMISFANKNGRLILRITNDSFEIKSSAK